MRNSAFLGTFMSEFIGAGDWRLAFLYRDAVEKVTVEQVNAAMLKYIIPTNRTMGRFYPTKEFDVAHDAIQSRIEGGKLANGVQYGIIKKENRGKTVSLSFSGRNGDVKSLMNKGLVPSFTARMLNKGTTSKTRQQIEDELAKLKTSLSFRGTNGNIYANISSTEENLMASMALMADILKNPAFDPAELEKLKTEELAQIESYKNEPNYLAVNKVSLINNSYPLGHPNHVMNVEERVAAVKNLNIDAIKKFYDEFYGLGKSILVGIGNLQSDAVKAFIEKEFGDFKSKHAYEQIARPYSASKAANEDIITPDKQNALTYGSLGVEMSQYDDDFAALNIAGTILGGGFLNSRIADRLRQKDGVSYGAGANFSADGSKTDRNSALSLYAIYAPANYDKVQLGFKEEIARFIKDGITEEELKNAVNGWVQAQSVSRAKDNELSSLVNNNIFYDRDMSFHKVMEEKVSKLTVADVNAAIKKYVQPYEKWTVVNAGDFKKE